MIAAWEANEDTQAEIAARFGVAVASAGPVGCPEATDWKPGPAPQDLDEPPVRMSSTARAQGQRTLPLIEPVRAHLVYQPAYSEDMNPIELA